MTTAQDHASSPVGFGAFQATLFLGALNDNISKLLSICYATAVLTGSNAQSAYLSLAGACFILPYLLFSNIAGYLADRFSKKSVMVWTKVLEIAVMALGWLLAARHAVYGLLAVLFLMGTQSAFFSPAKYGFLPETHSEEKLSKANGITQLFTFTAIIVGGWAGGALSAACGMNLACGFLVCIAIAVLGTVTSLFITTTPPGNPDLRFRFADPLSPHWKTFKEIVKDRTLTCAVFGNTYFWFTGTIIQLILVPFVQTVLGGDAAQVGILQAAIAIGIAAGCCLAGCLSRKGIAYHFVVPGAAILAMLLLLLAVFGTTFAIAIPVTVLAGISGGFMVLPMTTAIQERSPKDRRGRYLGATNALDCISMLAGSFYLFLLPVAFHCGPRAAIAILGILTLTAAALLRPGMKAARNL